MLTRLDLGECALGDAGAAALVPLLHPSSPIQTLELCGNRIGARGVDELARALLESKLKKLGLGWNNLCHVGIRPLADALFGNLTVSSYAQFRGKGMEKGLRDACWVRIPVRSSIIHATCFTSLIFQRFVSSMCVAIGILFARIWTYGAT